MLAMDDNVNAYCLNECVVWSFFASMLNWPNDFGHFNRAL